MLARSRLYLASDHAGWRVKRRLGDWLRRQGWPVLDLGPERQNPNDDYPIWAARLGRAVAQDRGSRGILICRSGVGMAMAANKISGIRAVQGWSPAVAAQSRKDENTNVLALDAEYSSDTQRKLIVKRWLTTHFRPLQRYQRRLTQLRRLDHAG